MLKVKVKAPAREGKANLAVIDLLSLEYKVPKNNISLISGTTSNLKIVEIKEGQAKDKRL